MKKKKFLVIGAGTWQINGIKKLISQKHEVHVCDSRLELLKKIKKVRKHLITDFQNLNSLLRIVKKHGIDDVVSFGSDSTLQQINAIKKKKREVYYSNRAIQVCIKKNLFRRFQKDNKLPYPKFIDTNLHLRKFKSLNKEYLIKPNFSSGSQGIFNLSKKLNSKKFFELCKISKNISLDKKIILEKKLKGNEYGGNCFIYKNNIINLSITKKKIKQNVVIGHIFPSNINYKNEIKIKNYILKILYILKINTAVINFDIKIYKRKIYFLEISLRNGGNGITEIVKFKSLFDYEKVIFDYKDYKYKIFDKYYYCSYLFGSSENGILKNINNLPKKNRSILQIRLFKNKGDKIFKFKNNTNSIGIVIFKIKKISEYDSFIEKIKKNIKFKIEN